MNNDILAKKTYMCTIKYKLLDCTATSPQIIYANYSYSQI
ncbi:hypothetical protein DSUL_20141 [Desulfovibrionales bacterium]